VSRKLAHVARGGKPVPPDLELYVRLLHAYNDVLLVQSWSLQRAKPSQAQLKVRWQPFR